MDIWTYYVAADMTGHRVCEVKHLKPAWQCQMAHQIPDDAVWVGKVSKYERGDFFIDLKLARRKFRNAMVRWQRQLNYLSRKRCAPAFKAYLKDIIDDHVKSKPVFKFTANYT